MSMPLSTRYEQARRTGCLHLSHCGLDKIPPEVFEMTDLVRLDLGWNELTEIPDEIAELGKLEQLWCNSNPIKTLTPLLCKCSKLKVIDLRNTFINDIPREVGRLKNLVEFDLRGNTLRSKLSDKADSVIDVMEHLAHKDVRRRLKERLEEDLREGIYREVADGEEATRMIKVLVKAVFQEFKDNAEVKNVIRNCDRLFPEDLELADAAKIREVFVTLRRENEMKKLAADLELKIRNIYYDRIDPQKVEGIVKGVYSVVITERSPSEFRERAVEFESRIRLMEAPQSEKLQALHKLSESISGLTGTGQVNHKDLKFLNGMLQLDDIKFLIQFSPTLFPEHSEDIDPEVLRDNMRALQDKMAKERQAAIDTLFKALKAYYADTEPDDVKRLCAETSEFFKKAMEIKSLAADVNVHFPQDYLDAIPKMVRKSFKQHS